MLRVSYTLGVAALAAAFSCGAAARHYGLSIVGPIVRSITAPDQPVTFSPTMIGRTTVYESTPGSAEIVMLGDSITDWGNWNEALPNLKLINRGVTGDTSAGVLARVAEAVQRKPKVVVLMIGVNDILQGRSPGTVARNIEQIVRTLRENQIHVILQSVLLLSREAGFGANPHIKHLNLLLRDVAADQSAKFLDLNPTLAPDGALHPDFTRDGLHLAGRAYMLWADRLRPLLLSPS